MIMTAAVTGTAATAGIRAGTVIMTAMIYDYDDDGGSGESVRLPLLLG